MPKTKPKIVTDKVAGLESHQFSRDEHRFAALPVKNLDIARLPRQPRVGNNSRNNSDGVFQFGGTLNYPDPRERYISEVAQHEKQRLQQKRDKLDERINLKRDWIDGMERERWERMSREYVKEQELWKVKHGRTKLGAHSVNYNPITLAYHDTEGGRRLAEQDAKAMNRIAVRATRLYLKNNSFDPTMCTDIPRRLEAPVAAEGLQRPVAPAAEIPDANPQITGRGRQQPQRSHPADAPQTVLPLGTYQPQPRQHIHAGSSPDVGASDGSVLQRPQFGRRSYKILQNVCASQDLPTPRSLLGVVTSTSRLVQERALHELGTAASAGSESVAIDTEGGSWARKH